MEHVTATDFTDIVLDTRIKTILLDLDNTCYLYDPCHENGLRQLQIELEKIVGPLADFSITYQEAQNQVKKRIPTQAASHSRILYVQALFEILHKTDGHIHAPTLEKVYWEAFFAEMKPTAGLSDFLANCHKNDTTVVVVSDLTTTIQCQKLIALGIAKSIDFLVTAEEVGADKPDPKPFLVALEKAHGDRHTAVVIGDNYERDIKGASALGIDSILITHGTQYKKTPLR